MLWLSCQFPHLALEVFSRGDHAAATRLVGITSGDPPRIHDCSPRALSAGIAPGMTLGAALSLDAALQTLTRNPEAELAALHTLAAWAMQFTPVISLQPPAGMLLEIEGSLKLFGSLAQLGKRITEGLAELGYSTRIGVAPTPLGAWLLCRAGHTQPVTDTQALTHALRRLPVQILERADYVIQSLLAMGVSTIGDCLRLPRSGLGQRFGPEFVAYLDRALGRIPDPRVRFSTPPAFEGHLSLPAEVTHATALLFAARRLFLELHGLLRACDSGTQECRLTLIHQQIPATTLQLGLIRPSRDPEHLLGLLRERLERLVLPAPVIALTLHAERFSPTSPDALDLFAPPEANPAACSELLERLRARLGHDAVHALAQVADHRPEQAWRYCQPGEAGGEANTCEAAPPRPVWLLPKPTPLRLERGRPWLDGQLRLAHGPERIESGWWDGDRLARDYFIAENPRWQRFWIFRPLHDPQNWFLHGIFS